MKKNSTKNQAKLIILVLIVALLIRVIVMIFSLQLRENTDVLRYRDWGRIAYLYGMSESYKPDHLSFGTLANNQPPGSTYIITSAYQINILAAKVFLKIAGNTQEHQQFAGIYLQNAILRLPQIIADEILGLLIFLLVKRYKSSHALLASSLFLFNPLVIYNSSFWGQMDSLNNMFLFSSLFLLLNKRFTLAVICFFFSLFVKVSLIFLLPLFLVVLYKSDIDKKRLCIAVGVSLALILVLTLPIAGNPIVWYIHYFSTSSLGEMQNITNFAFNFWWSMYKPYITILGNKDMFSFSEVRLQGSPLDTLSFFGIPIGIIGVLLFLGTSIPLYYRILRKKTMLPSQLFLFFALSALLGFMLLPRMHERYMYPLFPLFACFVGLVNKEKLLYVILSIVNVINLYIVWHPFRIAFLPYNLMINMWFQWSISIISVLCTIILYKKSLRFTTHET